MDRRKPSNRWMAGFIGLLGGLVLLIVISIASRLFFDGRVSSEGDVYALASQRAIASPAVIRALGSPITASLEHSTFNGSESTIFPVFGLRWLGLHRSRESAVIRMHLAGTRDRATLFATAKTSISGWSLETLSIKASRSTTPIDLLQKSN